jgi:hypothetical protein
MQKECDYCKKAHRHGGKCNGNYKETPCLYYEKDPRGMERYDDSWISISLGEPIPNEGECLHVLYRGIKKNIRINKIKEIDWHREGIKGLRGIRLYLGFYYWTEENGEIPEESEKLKLEVIKGGK